MVLRWRQAAVHQPIKRICGMIYSQPHQLRISGFAADSHDVLEMQFGGIDDAFVFLQTCSSRAHLAGGVEQGAADNRGCFQHQHPGTALGGENCRW